MKILETTRLVSVFWNCAGAQAKCRPSGLTRGELVKERRIELDFRVWARFELNLETGLFSRNTVPPIIGVRHSGGRAQPGEIVFQAASRNCSAGFSQELVCGVLLDIGLRCLDGEKWPGIRPSP